jgi:hypothetical protein
MWKKKLSDGDLKATIGPADCERSKTIGECGIFQPFGSHDNK